MVSSTPSRLKPIQRPEQHQIELPLGGILKELLEFRPIPILATRLIHIFTDNLPALRFLACDELSEFAELILRILLSIHRGHTSIKSDSYHFQQEQT
jgi:hypothetical protein